MPSDDRSRPTSDEYRDGWERTFGRPGRRLGKHWLDGRCESCGHKHSGKCGEPVGDGCDDDDRPIWKTCDCEGK